MQDIERPRSPQVVRDAAFLAHASGQAVYDFMKAKSSTYSLVDGTPEGYPGCHLLEYIMSRRREPLIDLALAEFGRSGTVLSRLYRHSSSTIRAVLCSNAATFYGPVADWASRDISDDDDEPLLSRVLTAGTPDEFRAFCENPHMSSGFYTALLSLWNRPDRISPDRFLRALEHLGRNTRMQTPYGESEQRFFYDGGSQYDYDKAFFAAWELVSVLPVNQPTARALYALLKRAVPVPLDNLDDLLALWWGEPVGQFEIDYIEAVRETVVRCRPLSMDDVGSPDRAVRRAFYARVDPADRDVANADWNEWLARDDFAAIWLEENPLVMKSPLGRRKLHDALRADGKAHGDMTRFGFFKKRVEELQRNHPEYFGFDII